MKCIEQQRIDAYNYHLACRDLMAAEDRVRHAINGNADRSECDRLYASLRTARAAHQAMHGAYATL